MGNFEPPSGSKDRRLWAGLEIVFSPYLSNTLTNLCIALYCNLLYCVVLSCVVLLIYCYVDIIQYSAMHKFVGVLDNPQLSVDLLRLNILRCTNLHVNPLRYNEHTRAFDTARSLFSRLFQISYENRVSHIL